MRTIAACLLLLGSARAQTDVEEVVNVNAAGQVLERYTRVDGKRHGTYESFHENGTRSFAGTYVENDLDGEATAYHDNGQLARRGRFVEGRLRGIVAAY